MMPTKHWNRRSIPIHIAKWTRIICLLLLCTLLTACSSGAGDSSTPSDGNNTASKDLSTQQYTDNMKHNQELIVKYFKDNSQRDLQSAIDNMSTSIRPEDLKPTPKEAIEGYRNARAKELGVNLEAGEEFSKEQQAQLGKDLQAKYPNALQLYKDNNNGKTLDSVTLPSGTVLVFDMVGSFNVQQSAPAA